MSTPVATPVDDAAPVASAAHAGTPTVRGLSHLALSVGDLPAARDFWVEVMGFELAFDSPAYCLLLLRSGRIAVAVTDHAGEVRGPFDERRVGLDHVALAVEDAAVLSSWVRRLDRAGVPHSGVVESDAGHHLNLRAPDGLPVELFAMSAATATEFGLAGPDEAVALGHGRVDAGAPAG